MQRRLGEAKEEFKCFHFAIVDLLEEEEEIELEQANFDEHEERIGKFGDHLQTLILQDKPAPKEPADPVQKGLHGRLTIP